MIVKANEMIDKEVGEERDEEKESDEEGFGDEPKSKRVKDSEKGIMGMKFM